MAKALCLIVLPPAARGWCQLLFWVPAMGNGLQAAMGHLPSARVGVLSVGCSTGALVCSVPQGERVFMIKHHCGWSRFALRTRAGTSAKCSCWTSSMTPFTTAAGSTSPSMVSTSLLPQEGAAAQEACSLRCGLGDASLCTAPHPHSISLLQRGSLECWAPHTVPPELPPRASEVSAVPGKSSSLSMRWCLLWAVVSELRVERQGSGS